MTIRLLTSLWYALLILSLSGIRETALAVVSCQDLITPGGAYRYGDALALFTEYQGKTYAIAKSAISGGTTLPDGYFNLTAGISREYAMTGVDAASLKTAADPRKLRRGPSGDHRQRLTSSSSSSNASAPILVLPPIRRAPT